jgi:tRNA splicing ligase
MNLQENISRIKSMMGLLTEEEKSYESKPIVFVGTAGSGKSTTAKALSEKLGIPRIDVDEMEGSEEYEKLCKDEPGVEVNIVRTSDGHNYGETNDEYKRCVLTKLLDKYGNDKVIFDIGGDSIKNPDLLEDLPNLFVFGLPTTPEDDRPYIQFLKQRRIKRATEMGQTNLEDKTKDEDIQQSINSIREFYKGKTTINPRNENGESKTTDELVDEVIFKLT